MRLAWFTPMSPRSAIGRCGVGIASALASLGHEVEIWHADPGAPRPSPLPVRRFTPGPAAVRLLRERFDLAIYNFGNHLPFHEGIFEIAALHPGLAVVHDFVLHHFFAGWFLEKHHSPQAYFDSLTSLYPSLSARFPTPDALAAARLWESGELPSVPFASPILDNALAAVCHSRFQADSLRPHWPGPIDVIPLAYEPDTPAIPAPAGPDPAARPRILVIGHINPNKCVDHLLAALRGLPPVELICAGPIDDNYRARLEQLAAGLDPASSLSFTGFVSDAEMTRLLHNATLCANLRKPVTEGASASVIEEMFFSKPVLVYNEGFFAELPADTVLRCTPETLPDTLRNALANPASLAPIGRAARLHASRTFTYRHYAESIHHVIARTVGQLPVHRVLDTVGRELSAWGASPGDGAAARYAAVVSALFP
jgi:glycosyltransferase involved in cell wall biosynthesis